MGMRKCDGKKKRKEQVTKGLRRCGEIGGGREEGYKKTEELRNGRRRKSNIEEHEYTRNERIRKEQKKVMKIKITTRLLYKPASIQRKASKAKQGKQMVETPGRGRRGIWQLLASSLSPPALKSCVGRVCSVSSR